MHVISAHVHVCMDVLVKVINIICPSCTVMQMQGVRGVCALRALVFYCGHLLRMLTLYRVCMLTKRLVFE